MVAIMSPEECRAKAAQIRAIVDEQPDFADTAERIAREWERAAANLQGASMTPGSNISDGETG
jgi:hypothetical protein